MTIPSVGVPGRRRERLSRLFWKQISVNRLSSQIGVEIMARQHQLAPPRGLQAALSSFAAPSTGNRNKSKPSNIRVVVRIRPLSSDEEEKGYQTCVLPCLPLVQNHDTVSDDADDDCSNELISSSGSPTAQCSNKSRLAFLSRFSPAQKLRTTSQGNKTFRDKLSAFATPAAKTSSLDNEFSSTPLIRNTKRPIGEQVCQREMDLMAEIQPEVTNLVAGGRQFAFDTVFGPNATQEEVYDRSVSDAVRRNISRGYNTTIIAYGQTGGGKTFTMGGRRQVDKIHGAENQSFYEKESPRETNYSIAPDDGIILRAIHDLFKAKKRHESAGEVVIRLTYLEIWNDELHDLLCDDEGGESIKLRDHGEGGVQIKGLTTITVTSVAEALGLMDKASQRRTTGSTFVNARSSRSHAICTLTVTIYPALHCKVANIPASSEVITAKLTLVDLAGSERIKDTRVTGDLQKESICINKDLFVLGKVLSALADNRHERLKEHVPYRDSKLTRLLRDSLGGNCCTVIIACISPANCHLDESINTLRNAERSRSITNVISPNIAKATLTPAECAAMRAENKLLRGKLAEIKRRYEKVKRRDVMLAIAKGEGLPVLETQLEMFANNEYGNSRQTLDYAATTEHAEIQQKQINEERLNSSSVGDESDQETATVSSLLSFDLSTSENIDDCRLTEGEFVDDEIGFKVKLGEPDENSSLLTVQNFESFALKMESKSLQTQNKDLAEHIELQRRELVALTSLIEKQRKLLDEASHPAKMQESLNVAESQNGINQSIHSRSLNLAKESPTKYHKAISSFLGKRVSRTVGEDSVEMKEFKPFTSEGQYRALQVKSDVLTDEAARSKTEMELIMFDKRKADSELGIIKGRVSDLEKQLEDCHSQRLHLETRLQEEQKLRIMSEGKAESCYEHLAFVSHERDALLEKHAILEEEIRGLREALAVRKDERASLKRETRSFDSQDSEEKENRASANTPTSAATSTKGVLSCKSDNNSRELRAASSDNSKVVLSYSNSEHSSTQPSTANSIVPYDADDTNTTDDGSSSLETDARLIRLHAAKMLLWAERAISKSRNMTSSVCSSFASSQGTELLPNVSDLKPVPIPRTVTALTAVGKPPMLPQRSLVVQEECRQLVISNLDQMNKCQCQSSLFSGNAEHAEFYLPKLGMACHCNRSEDKEERPRPENDNPCALENILRPWQVDFLEHINIRDALDFVHNYNQRSATLAKEMRNWRRAKRLPSVKTKSCAVALHIWCRTCKAVVRSVRAQTSKGLKPTRPSFLELSSSNIPGFDDNRSVSTLGCGSLYQIADIDVSSQMEM